MVTNYKRAHIVKPYKSKYCLELTDNTKGTFMTNFVFGEFFSHKICNIMLETFAFIVGSTEHLNFHLLM